MTTGEEIRQALRSIIAQYLVTTKLREPKICTVLAVHANPGEAMICDCQPTDGTAYIKNVLLNANYQASNAGFILVPALGSIVEVSFNDDQNAFVSMVSQVTTIYLNGNNYGGLIQIQELVTKLNNLENKVNDLVSFSQTHTHSGVTVGSGVTGTGTPPVTGNLTTTQKADLENTTVQHGTGNLS